MINPSFHAYPSRVQTFLPYSRMTPLACDKLEWDTTGAFNTSDYCFVAPYDCIVSFYANVLWSNPPNQAALTLLFIKNNLPTAPDGSYGGEIAGNDIGQVFNPAGSSGGMWSSQISRLLKLCEGDRVWAVPCINCGGKITNAIGGNGNNTVNYFEGVIL